MTQIRSLEEVKGCIRDHRVMRYIHEFSENMPSRELTLKDWEVCLGLACRLADEYKPHLSHALDISWARVNAWTILNPGKLFEKEETSCVNIEQ